MRTQVLLLTFFALGSAWGANISKIHTVRSGTTTIQSGGRFTGAQDTGFEIRRTPDVDAHMTRTSGTKSPARVPAAGVPRPGAAAIVNGINFFGFNGMTHLDQRLAGGGNQFSGEPPDQGLAVGNGYVTEAVNNALAVYATNGTLIAGPIDLNSFFGLAPAIVRSTPPVFGPFITDPRLYFDSPTNRWFLTMTGIAVDPATGDFVGDSAILIAVSDTATPIGTWSIYIFDTADVTNTPDHAGCPCFGDQPLIGADQNGFYITTNEFAIEGDAFNGAQIYALSKVGLETGVFNGVQISGIPLAEGIAYSVQPATTPPGGAFDTRRGGTAYFLSALDFNNTLDNRIAVWALTNTSTLSGVPNVALTNVIVDSEVYGLPPAMEQKSGPTPLAELLKTKNNPLDIVSNEHLELVDGDDDRMQQAVFAAGSLWGSLGTVVQPPNGPARAGIAWFIVTPAWNGNALTAQMTRQGYLAADQQSVAYPSIGVNAAGKGVMTFTLSGSNYFPTAAFTTIDAIHGTGAIQIAAAGTFPEDGFTGYGAFGGRVSRWGDYTAAVADIDGSIWIAGEYIPNAPRSVLANWGTFIARVPE